MKHLSVKIEERVCYLGLNRPDKKNALNKELMTSLITFLENSKESLDYRVLVIYGHGGMFSSGADLEWMKEGLTQSPEENLNDAQLFTKLYRTLYEFPKPVIAMVEKGAYGGAIGIISCADIALASEDAQFAFSEVKLGLVPATISPYVVKKIGITNSRHLFLTAKVFNAEEAKSYNFIQQICSTTSLKLKTRETARSIARMGPKAIQATKQLLTLLDESTTPSLEIEKYTSALIAEKRSSSEGQEGLTAFFEKRKPHWHEVN